MSISSKVTQSLTNNIFFRMNSVKIILLFFVLCFAGCKKEEQLLRIAHADFQPQQIEKTYIGRNLLDSIVYWKEGNTVKINNNNPAKQIVGNGTDVWIDYYANSYSAVYPSGATLQGTNPNFTGGYYNIPITQIYTENEQTGFQDITPPMAAKLSAPTGVLYFRNFASLLRIAVMNGSLDYDFRFDSIQIDGKRNIRGNQYFTFNGDTKDNDISLGNLSSGGKRIILKGCKTGGDIPPGEMKCYNIIIAPITTPDSLTITILKGRHVGSGVASKNFVLAQNKAITLPHGCVAVQFFATDFNY